MAILKKPTLFVSCEKEMKRIAKQEAKLRAAAHKDAPKWKTSLAAKIPEKVRAGLVSAFAKAFGIVFERGTAIIEKTYSAENISNEHKINEYAAKVRGTKSSLRRINKAAGSSDLLNSAVTTVEGIALGALGIGLPDIVVFTGMLLKGVYECSLHYGYDYNKPSERLLILKLTEAALSKGDAYDRADAEAELLMESTAEPTDDVIREQIRYTAETFAVDMLVMKFIQGLPIVGAAGGLANPVYYNKVMNYVRLKYYKRCLAALSGEDN